MTVTAGKFSPTGDAAQSHQFANAPASTPEAAARKRLCDALGSRYSPSRVRLEDMNIYDQRIGIAKREIESLIHRMAEVITSGQSVILYGSVGTGKDRMLAAMLYEAAISASVYWINGLNIYGQFRDAIDGNRTESSLLQMLASPTVLAISDPTPPFGDPTDWNVATLYRIIDMRYRSCKCTWVTMNAQSPDEAEKQLSSRVFDRLLDGAVMIPCFWPSYREGNKAVK